jgi:hypothetical protein
MDWWTAAQPWLSIATAVFALVASAASIGSYVVHGRATAREDKRRREEDAKRATAEEELELLLELFKESPTANFEIDEYFAGGELGAQRGILVTWWNRGKMGVRMANRTDRKG